MNILRVIKNEKVVLFFIAIVFLSLSLFNIHFPAIQCDEAYDGVVANYIIYDRPIKMAMSMSVRLFNRNLPVMACEYISSLKSYLLVPFFLLFGMNVFALRLMPVTTALITLFLVYYLCKAWFDKRMALITIILTATNLTFVQYSRVGVYREELFQIFFLWAGLVSLWRYFEKKRNPYLYLGFFLFGLAVSVKVMFFWYVPGLVIACLVFRRKIASAVNIGFLQVVISLLSFMLGSLPIVFYNFQRQGRTVKLILDSLFVTRRGYNNLAYLDNLYRRIKDLIATLQGNISEREYWGIREAFSPDQLSLVIFAAGFTFLIFILLLRKRYISYSKNKILFFYILYSATFLCTPFTMSHITTSHLFVLFPFPQIVSALFLCSLCDLSNNKKIILYPIYLIFLTSALFNLKFNIDYHSGMRKTGGFSEWSTAIYDLAGYLENNRIFDPLAFEWGIHHNLPFLTDCAVMPVPIFGPAEKALRAYNEFILRDGPFYVIRVSPLYPTDWEREELFGSFRDIAKSNNKELTLNKIFYNRSGVPVYYLYKIH